MNEGSESAHGLSGFVGEVLEAISRGLGFAGGHDWLLLCAILTLGIHLIWLPYLWEVVKGDVAFLKARQATARGGNQGAWPALLSTACLLLFLWFFGSPAGQAFLRDRALAGTIAAANPDWRLLLGSLGLVALSLLTVGLLEQAAVRSAPPSKLRTTPEPFARRSFLLLFEGGGAFVRMRRGKPFEERTMSVVAHQALLLLVLLVAYWKWSVASLVLMDMTLLGAIGVDAIRMWFVSIHHRRTFG